MIKAISFDMWGTLITSNKNARQERVTYLQAFGRNYSSNAEIRDAISSIKKDVNDKVERYGVHYESHTIHQMILNRLGIDEISASTFANRSSSIFLEHQPIISQDTIDTLGVLAKDYKLYLASNTLMMNGVEFRRFFRDVKIDALFDKMIFSDELTVAKPNPRFYKAVQEAAGVMSNEILHVGDNPITDVRGPLEYGFKTMLVENGISPVPEYLKILNQKTNQ